MINVKKSKQQAGQAAAAIIFIENKDRIFKGQKHPHYYLGRQPPLILKFWISCLSSWLIFINFLIIIFYFNKHFICCCESPTPIELKDMHRKVLLGVSSMHWKVLLGVASMHRKVPIRGGFHALKGPIRGGFHAQKGPIRDGFHAQKDPTY